MKLDFLTSRFVRLGLLLAAGGLATSFVIGNDREPAHAPSTAATRAAGSSSPGKAKNIPRIDLAGLNRSTTTEIQDNLFYVPPPPAPPPRRAPPAPEVAAPPPKPTAPPLPFKFLGRLIDRGTTVIFVSHNGESLNLKEGDTTANLYRIEQITQTEVVFTYLPLEERQVLSIGAVN